MPEPRPWPLARPGFWALLLGIYAIAIWPAGPSLGGSDKLDHMAAFLALGVAARLAYPGMSRLVPLGLLATFGALIEFTQMIPALHRDADLRDWFADLAAAVAGVILADMLRRLRTGWGADAG